MKTLQQSMDRWKGKEEDLRQAVIDIALDLRRDLQLGNPVKTGRSCASWNVKANAMDTFKQPRDYFNPGSGRFQDARTDVGNFRVGQTIHISNLQDYIQILEASHAAAAGWVRRTQAAHTELMQRRLARVFR